MRHGIGMVELALALFAAAYCLRPAAADAQTARADFVDRHGQAVGHADLRQGPNGTLIYIELRGLPPGPHGMHFHSVGTCDDAGEGFQASRGHHNPDNRQHGLMNPQGPDRGDLPNIFVHADGTARAELFTTLVSVDAANPPALMDSDGAAIVIHESRDDHITQPIGGAGARIACGVIKVR